MTHAFDEAYYRRYYLSESTRIYPRERHEKLVAGVVNLVEWFAGRIDTVLDVGAGLGWWGQWLRQHRRHVVYTSTEVEPAICKRYKHQQADIATWRSGETFDLVVCQGVLPYLEDQAAAQAIENLAAMSHGFLYLEAITTEDFGGNIDPTRTDTSVKARKASWYRGRLTRHYRELGAGLWAARCAEHIFYALEAPRDAKAKRR